MRHFVLGEFASKDQALNAARRLRAAGFHDLDLHSPYPIDEAAEVLGLRPSRLPVLGFAAAAGGAALGYVIQWFTNAVQYPVNVANRPAHSGWTSIPITFETTVLVASVALFAGILAAAGLPHLSHPFFEVAAFESATIDRFWVSARISPKDRAKILALLEEAKAATVSEVSR